MTDVIHSVLGPIDPAELGATSMHEHLLLDSSVWLTPAREPEPAEAKVTLPNLGYVRWNLLAMRDNLLIEDPAWAQEELHEVKALGGSGIVDLTIIGLGRRVAELPAISRATGLHVMIGCGYYVHSSHPPYVEAASVDELTERLLTELRSGVDGTPIKPALIGEIGTSDPITDREWKVVTAAGHAAAESGSAINIHLDQQGAHGLEVIEVLVAANVPADRIVLSHLDEALDYGYHQAIAESGVILEYDTFGSEFYFSRHYKNPSDFDRMEYVRRLVGDGYGDQLVLACDVWCKAQMQRFGGMGYAHLLKRIVPALRAEYGIDQAAIDTMLIDTPRRLLARPREW